MKNSNATKLTSVKVDPELFEKFKIEGIRMKFGFTQLVNRAMKLYLNDPNFKKQISDHKLDQ
jgi:hypothetical protein